MALVKRADRAMRSLSDLLNALLDFSQLDAGVIQPNLDSFPAQRLLEAMREEFEIEASEKELQFTVQNCPCWVRSDSALLARMLRNLVSNAVKYTPSGGQVTVVCHQKFMRLRAMGLAGSAAAGAAGHRPIFAPARSRPQGYYRLS